MASEQPGVSITGSGVVAGNIGGSGNTGSMRGPVAITGGGNEQSLAVVVEQLRAALAQLRSTLEGASDCVAEPDDVDDVIDALDRSEPDLPRAAGRWARLYRRIPEPLRHVDTVAKIVRLMADIQHLMS